MEKSFLYISPIGPLELVEKEEKLCRLAFLTSPPADSSLSPPTPLLQEGAQQLSAYFSGKLQTFSLPFLLEGTPFQKKVWQALLSIPYGKTASYQDLAIAVGCPKGARAIGMANNKNPLPIFFPCHRVIGKNGTLTGYAGGLEKKKFLLNLEQKNR